MTAGPQPGRQDGSGLAEAGSGYALGPGGVAAVSGVVFALSLVLGLVVVGPPKPAAAPASAAVVPRIGVAVEAPGLDEAVALPELAPRHPPAVRRRARWKRAEGAFERAQASARGRLLRAVTVAAPAPPPVAAPAPAPAPPPAAGPAAPPAPGTSEGGYEPVAPSPVPGESETPAPFDDGGVPDSGEFDYDDGS